MKKIIKLFPVLLIATMTACDGIDKEHAVIAPINYDAKAFKMGVSSTFELNPYNLYDMLNNKEDFAIEFYRPTCGSCKEFEPIFDKYIVNTTYQWYRFNTTMNEADESFFTDVVMKEHPAVFSNFEYVPSLYFIKNGKLSYEVDSKKFASYTSFATIANKHFIKSSLYSVTTLDGFKEILKDQKDLIVYVFDNTSSISIDIYKTIYSIIAGKNKPVLVLYKNQMSFANYSAIASYMSMSYEANFACIVEDHEVLKTVDYIIDGGSSFKEFITSYLG